MNSDKLLYMISEGFDYGLLIYSLSSMSFYVVLGVISIFALRKYLNNVNYNDYETILSSPLCPGISVIAPAYNEGATIVENVRSLLSLHYGKYEVIIVNDGSKDDTLKKVIEVYDLVAIDYPYNQKILSKNIRGIYKSTRTTFKNLTVIDKENGGKADALNAGINVSLYDHIACIDVDCILETDSMIKMIKPFLQNEKRVVATGGVVRIANSCVVEDGRITEVRLPENFLARVQTLEYIRAFLMGRMAWSHLDGMLIISGAFGMFDKRIVIEVGGYNTKTVGEDMELIVRMRRHMLDKGVPYGVGYIPDPLCWTEAPISYKVLGRQRNRWARGSLETLWLHRKMLFNPKYKLLGLLSYPYWLFNEYLAPIIEFTGGMIFLTLAMLGLINWPFFFLLLSFTYSFAVFFSIVSIFSEEFTFYQYKKKSEIVRLVMTAFLEPIVFHPFMVYSAFMGNLDKLDGKKTWGDMTRAGFGAATPNKK